MSRWLGPIVGALLRDALIARGVDQARIDAVGYGDRAPIITNEDCDLSNRVELRRSQRCE